MRFIVLITVVGTSLAIGCSTHERDRTAHSTLDPSAVLAYNDTFEILANGRSVGKQVLSLVKDGDRYRFVETTTSPRSEQTTQLLMSNRLEMITLSQRGKVGGQETWIDVSYENGRATGNARTPTPQGLIDVIIDTTVPTDVVDDNVVASLLPAFDWTRSPRTVNVFQSGKNEIAQYVMIVSGMDTVVTTFGTERAYKIEVTGGALPLTFYLRLQRPHRVLRIVIPGTPVEIRRVSK